MAAYRQNAAIAFDLLAFLALWMSVLVGIDSMISHPQQLPQRQAYAQSRLAGVRFLC
jgi:hypothetical protein